MSPIDNLVSEAERRGWMTPVEEPTTTDTLERIADALESIAATLTRIERGSIRGGVL